jgi:hypothetical protein
MNKKYRLARNKHGEVIAVYLKEGKWHLDYGDSNGEDGDYEYEITPYTEDELTFIDEEEEKNLSYWDKLLHQYAGMAMQAMVGNNANPSFNANKIASNAVDIAIVLIEKLKRK